VLAGQVVTLRPARMPDATGLHAILAEPSVARWWGEPEPVGEIHAKINGEDECKLLVIERAGRLAGGIQYHEETDPRYRHAGIDIFLSTGCQGQGAGAEAIALLADYLFTVRGHHRITIDPAAANTRAVRCYSKAGFRPVGVMRQYERDGSAATFHDGLLMELLSSDPRPAPRR
jgi:aminoglycoside 6'-N-acetyltransferase